MGWTFVGNRKLVWGDVPQDIVDDAIANEIGNDFYKKLIPKDVKEKLIDKLYKNKKLRKEIDEEYKREWRRSASDKEFEYLIRVALDFGKGSRNSGDGIRVKILRSGRNGNKK